MKNKFALLLLTFLCLSLASAEWSLYDVYVGGCDGTEVGYAVAIKDNQCMGVNMGSMAHAYYSDGTSFQVYEEDNCNGSPVDGKGTDDVNNCFEVTNFQYFKLSMSGLDRPVNSEYPFGTAVFTQDATTCDYSMLFSDVILFPTDLVNYDFSIFDTPGFTINECYDPGTQFFIYWLDADYASSNGISVGGDSSSSGGSGSSDSGSSDDSGNSDNSGNGSTNDLGSYSGGGGSYSGGFMVSMSSGGGDAGGPPGGAIAGMVIGCLGLVGGAGLAAFLGQRANPGQGLTSNTASRAGKIGQTSVNNPYPQQQASQPQQQTSYPPSQGQAPQYPPQTQQQPMGGQQISMGESSVKKKKLRKTKSKMSGSTKTRITEEL